MRGAKKAAAALASNEGNSLHIKYPHWLKHLPARIAFPGWVIFLPPGAAAANRRFPSHTLWTGVKELATTPRHAAGCCWSLHPRLQTASLHGPSETQNGLYRDDIFLSANKNRWTSCVISTEYDTQQCAPCPMRQSQHNHWRTTPWPCSGRVININHVSHDWHSHWSTCVVWLFLCKASAYWILISSIIQRCVLRLCRLLLVLSCEKKY